MISFLMMAKNVADYIEEAITEIQKESKNSWELIVIDDGSEDDTYQIVEKVSKSDPRIILERNPFTGKVAGTSYAHSLSKGDIIKCIDSDDVLLRDWFDFIPEMQKYDAHCHAALIVDENLKKMAMYNANPKLITASFEGVASNLISLPKWNWSFKREVAEKIFPLPSELQFEDVWMAILIKKHTKNILNIGKSLYLYRQHETQTFGGIVNFQPEKVRFRARRLVKLIEILRVNDRVLLGSGLDFDSFEKCLCC